MITAEFEEKEYENAANGEFFRSTREVWALGQRAEEYLAYDVAVGPLPASFPIWAAIALTAPRGTLPSAMMWPEAPPSVLARLPGRFVSLFLQYKRPCFLKGPGSNQYDHWRRPYYRIELLEHQHDILQSLERSIASLAVVRYAAPVFYRRSELVQCQLDGRVLLSSNYASPLAIGPGHKVYTYAEAGSSGYANPHGKPVRGISIARALKAIAEHASEETLRAHVQRLGDAMEDAGPFQFLPGLAEQFAMAAARFQGVDEVGDILLQNMLRIVSRTTRAGTVWQVLRIPSSDAAQADA